MEIRDKIIQASSTLFTNNGLKSVTMDDVASSIGISKRTIYETFKDKRELICATVDFFIEAQQRQTKKIENEAANLVEELFSLFELMDENFSRRGRISLDVRKYYPDIFQQHYLKHYEESSVDLQARLGRGISQGIILANTNVPFAVYVIMETITNLMISPEKILVSTQVPESDAFKYVIIYFFRGISTQKGIEMIDKRIAEKNNRI